MDNLTKTKTMKTILLTILMLFTIPAFSQDSIFEKGDLMRVVMAYQEGDPDKNPYEYQTFELVSGNEGNAFCFGYKQTMAKDNPWSNKRLPPDRTGFLYVKNPKAVLEYRNFSMRMQITSYAVYDNTLLWQVLWTVKVNVTDTPIGKNKDYTPTK